MGAAGRAVTDEQRTKLTDDDELRLPGDVFFLKPRADGAVGVYRGGAGRAREELLWQLNDVLLSKSMLAHATLDAHISALRIISAFTPPRSQVATSSRRAVTVAHARHAVPHDARPRILARTLVEGARLFWSLTVRLRGKRVVSSVGGAGRERPLSRAHSGRRHRPI